MPPHAKKLRYFKSNPCPEDWSISEYLNFRHRPVITPRRVLDGWRKSLRIIANCTSPSCCTPEQRRRAQDLIARYNEKGKGSDRQYGKSWLTQKTSKAAAPINIGAVYQGSVMNAPVTQTNNNQLLSQTDGLDGDQDDDLDSLNNPEIYQPKDNESEEDGMSEASTDNTSEDLSAAQVSFANTYKGMDKECQWVLNSGRTVESVIFSTCQALDADSFANSLLQSFVLDISDPEVLSLFTNDEWDEIRGHVLPLPKPDIVLADSMRRFFSVKTAEELRDVLRTTNYLPEGVPYDQDIHFNSQWADVVIRMLLMLFEAPGEPLRAGHLEDWYTSYLWSPILDHCLIDLPGMTVERKESPCRATGVRKNRLRTKTGRGNRLKMGRRLDAIIRTVEDDYYEYGGMEVARTFNGVTSSKWLGDSFKLAKALRDMLFRLHELVDHREAIVKRLQVVGVFNAGLAFQLIRMSHPKGYVCLIQREKMQQVPNSVQDLNKLLQVLMNVALMKQIIKDCKAAVNERGSGKTEAEIYKELIEGAVSGQAKLGWAADTP